LRKAETDQTNVSEVIRHLLAAWVEGAVEIRGGEYHSLIGGDGFRPTGYIDPTSGDPVTVESK
jgi:hypothetical protein